MNINIQTINMDPISLPHTVSPEQPLSAETWLRLNLIIAMNGDVTKAQIALRFVKGEPEASEEYRRFKEWEDEKYLQYCRKRGFKPGIPAPTSPEEP